MDWQLVASYFTVKSTDIFFTVHEFVTAKELTHLPGRDLFQDTYCASFVKNVASGVFCCTPFVPMLTLRNG